MYLIENQIKERPKELGEELLDLYKDSSPIFLGVLNGSFVFMADLIREYEGDCETDFCRVKSYENNKRGELTLTKKWELDFKDKDVIVVEDIVDFGTTIEFLKQEIQKESPRSITICSLLKRKSCPTEIDLVGFEIEDDSYVVGYGLDDNGLKRNLKQIYKLNKICLTEKKL